VRVLELDFRKVKDRTNHGIRTENPVHAVDTSQEVGPVDGENYSTGLRGLRLLPFWIQLLFLLRDLRQSIVYYESIKRELQIRPIYVSVR